MNLSDEKVCDSFSAGKNIWVFPKIVVPQNGWFIMENPIKMDDLGVPLFSETSIYILNRVLNPFQGSEVKQCQVVFFSSKIL